MWPFSNCSGSDGCTARNPNKLDAEALVALLPFAAAFLIVDILVVRHIFPKLSRAHDEYRDGENHYLPAHAPPALRQAHAEHGSKSWKRRGAALAFGTTVSLAVTLGLLILGEILEAVDPVAKNLALHVIVPSLLLLLIGLVPWLQCRAIITSAGWSFQRTSKGAIPKVAWALQFTFFGAWLFSFWTIGNTVPKTAARPLHEHGTKPSISETLTKECLERVGVVGICLMALLAGFASVSTPWHTFIDAAARKKRPVTEADINRKQTGLEATSEMLTTKRHQLQLLERKISDPAAVAKNSSGLVGKMMGTFRGLSKDEADMRALRVDIAGLETMEANLASNLSLMQSHRAATVRASTACGRILLVPSYVFACYCVYRILATTLTTIRRIHSPSSSFANSDPINRFLGLMARHWDPKLDQLAWARTISFALSGVILLASANSVVQTFHLFAKWTPGLLRHAQANLALAVGQITATYVISASLLLRSQLPAKAGGAVTGVLQGALSPAFVDHWFETWFLLGGALTAVGIWMGRKLSRGYDDDWDDYGTEEMGAKRS
ncbi:hypothetical protein QQS21_009747 [Conoideocrella luteorostrata]|uniref:Uncharacterized protein n=1 Tax=Conoideocrella luteorostrata TaxID=1105319 RepID=A0AAJ0CJ21_9HYPO|nr:hypothetical protein QQS21_009747 [Conoideocrella luteorostrata]